MHCLRRWCVASNAEGDVVGSDCNIVAVHCVQDLEGTRARYLPALYRAAFRQLRNHEDAEDAVQDALLSAFTTYFTI
jgi:hypothetical protein